MCEEGWIGNCGTSRCKLLYIEWINNKVLLYSIGNYIQYPVINHNGKEKINKDGIHSLGLLTTGEVGLCAPPLFESWWALCDCGVTSLTNRLHGSDVVSVSKPRR